MNIHESTERRIFLAREANLIKLDCDICHSQIQLIGYINTVPAVWKCRNPSCRRQFEWEPKLPLK